MRSLNLVRHTSRLFASSLALAVLAAPFALAQDKDRVYLKKDEKAKEGKIIEESLVEVSFQGGIKFPDATIERIQYGEGNAPFAKAQEAMDAGNFAAAITQLEALKPAREIFIPRRLYVLGRAYEGAHQDDKAVECFNEILSKFSKNRYARDCVKSLVELQVRVQKYADAIATTETGIRIAEELKRKDLALDFRYFKAVAYESQNNKPGEAESEYRAVVSEAGNAGPSAARTAGLATCGLARLAAKTGDAAKAKTLVEAIIKGNDTSLLGPAYGAMGEALLVQGLKESSADKLREAVFDNYLRAIVVYPPSPGDSTDPLEQAMFGCARAFKKLSELDNKQKEQADSWKKQGISMCKDFRDRYAGSRLLKSVTDLQAEFGK